MEVWNGIWKIFFSMEEENLKYGIWKNRLPLQSLYRDRPSKCAFKQGSTHKNKFTSRICFWVKQTITRLYIEEEADAIFLINWLRLTNKWSQESCWYNWIRFYHLSARLDLWLIEWCYQTIFWRMRARTTNNNVRRTTKDTPEKLRCCTFEDEELEKFLLAGADRRCCKKDSLFDLF